MLIKIAPAGKDLRPITLIRELRIWCYYSLADAKHMVEYAMINGSAIIHVPQSKNEDLILIQNVCASCGFSAEKL